MESLSAMESHQKDDYMIHKCMDCIKGVTRVTSTKPPCKKEYKCGTVCPVCFKLCLSFINIIKICTNRSTNVPNTWLIANKLGQLTCINGRRFQSCNSNNSQFSFFTGSTKNSPIRGWGGLSKNVQNVHNWIILITSKFIWFLVIWH